MASKNSDVVRWLSNIKTVKRQTLELRRDLQKGLSKQSLQKIGDFLVEVMKKRVRDGKGVFKMQGNTYTLPPLDDKYEERRTKLPLSPDTSPTKSNLTLTGEMIDSIFAKIKGHDIIISVKGKHNLDKVVWNAENGRSFMYLSKDEYKIYENMIEDEVNIALSKFFSKKT